MKHQHHLPSKYQIGDTITVKFAEGASFEATIAGVHFLGKNKVKYDVDVKGISGDLHRIANVDSEFVL